ncbi:MAG TPA: carbohydrate kinase family protein [Chthonomonadaceae bacterium]|nr:carbohydrate kinase family protein [Chthonomonadaceae bacterium]
MRQEPPLLDVCCAADLCVDLIVTGDVTPRFRQVEQLVDDYTLELGGSATIFASQFARLGGRAGLIGAVGADAFGQFVRERLKALGVDVRRVRQQTALKTGLGLALIKPDGDRAILTYSGTIDAVQPSDLTPDLVSAFRHWHIASYFLLNRLRGYWPLWLERCRAAGRTTSLDTNWDPEDRWEGVRELLPLVDVFLPNEAEALAISKAASVEEAGERLAVCGPLVVVKRGAQGAVAFQGGRRWEVGDAEAAEGPLAIVDSVGAGDNFDAGFLRAWLLGHDSEACLRLACRCARASLSAPGGFQGQLWEDFA